MTPSQSQQFARIIDIAANYQSSLDSWALAHNMEEIFAQLCQITSRPELRDLKNGLTDAGIDLATLQEVLAAWGFQYGSTTADNYLQTLTQQERDCRDYWLALMESSNSLYVPAPPSSLQSLMPLFHSDETIDTTFPSVTGGKMLINQWYLMRFECYLTEIASIEERIVKHRGSALSEVERVRLYKTLLGAVKDANGNPIFPIPRDWSPSNIDLIAKIKDAYSKLAKPPKVMPPPNPLWHQLYISTSSQTTLPS
ncbi:MAG: hypothetical protein ACTSRK_09535 [Promethearchaeota archaeon]